MIVSFVIRPAVEADLPGVIALLPESTSGVVNAVLDDVSLLARLSSRSSHTGLRSCWIGQMSGAAVGHTLGYDDDATGSERKPGSPVPAILRPFMDLRVAHSWYLSSLAVEPGSRRRGVGRKLLQHSAAMARDAGFPVMSLHVFEDKTPALSLYHSAGFKEVGRTSAPRHPTLTARGALILMAGDTARIAAAGMSSDRQAGVAF